MKRSKSGFNLPGILATLLLLVTTLYTPTISVHAEGNEEGEVVVTQKVNSEWNGGYVAELIITNNTGDELQNWKLTVDDDLEITSIWNATAQEEGDAVIILPMDYNAKVVAGGSVNIGFVAAGEYSELAITCSYDGKDATAENGENNNSENNIGNENSGENNTGDVTPGENNEANNPEGNNSEENNTEENVPEEIVPVEVQLNEVTGIVCDGDGNAVANAQVTIDENAKQFVGENAIITALTDENGLFVLGLPAGDYRLHITCENYEQEIVSFSVIDETENAAGTIVINEIKPVIRGYARDTELESKYFAGAEVIIREGWDAHDSDVIAEYKTDENGYFEAELPEGQYTIQLKVSGYGSKYFNVVSEKNSDPQLLTIRSSAHIFDGKVFSAYENKNGSHTAMKNVTVQFYSQTTGELADETVTDNDGSYQVMLKNDMYYAVFQRQNYKTLTVNDISGDLVALVSDTYQNELDPVFMECSYPMGIVSGRVVDQYGSLLSYSKGQPGIYFNRIGVVGDEPVQAPDVNVMGILNWKNADGTYGDGTYYYLLPVGKYQVFIGEVITGGETAVSQIIEVKENEITVVPDIQVNRVAQQSYPYNYKATICVIDAVTGEPIKNAQIGYLGDGASSSTAPSSKINASYSHTDANGELKYQHNRAFYRMMVSAVGYKERTINVIANTDYQTVYCAMVPVSEPDPDWEK